MVRSNNKIRISNIRVQNKRVLNKRSSPKRNKKGSNVKYTWEQFLNTKESRDLLKKSWKTPNPQKVYAENIRRLHKKYSSIKH